ncbi:hypothetical protein ACTJI2_00320 [Pseudoxanthomonas sp. 22568]|uniref:hypothetical protein n=1 Tax=Pseudoxanthomonas sp. 22568 TaxID=3453945 RepID=UPI003F84C2E7
MKTSTAMLYAILLLAAPTAVAWPDEATTPATTISGGHWKADAREGTYRVVVESVGFEHVSCRVWIEWMSLPEAGQPARVAARVPFAEVSTGFWSCDPGGKAIALTNSTLTIGTTHTYSREARTFQAILGAPGEYRMVGQ